MDGDCSVQSPYKAFSLVELIAVIALITVLAALAAPAFSGMANTAGRKGAVNILLNTFEQARVAAIESGRSVMVVFARPNFPDQDAVAVFRETASGTGPYEALTRWQRLPKGVLLHKPPVGQNLFTAAIDPLVFDESRLPFPKPGNVSEPLGVLVFNDQGAVDFPGTTATRKLIVSEGVRGTGGTEALISQKKANVGGFEIISLAKFTGRAQLDVTSAQ